MKQCGKI